MLGKILRDIRKSQNKTLQEVAIITGLSVSYISDVERGRTLPSLKTCAAFSSAYEVAFFAMITPKEVTEALAQLLYEIDNDGLVKTARADFQKVLDNCTHMGTISETRPTLREPDALLADSDWCDWANAQAEISSRY